jgi:hypothetical protein
MCVCGERLETILRGSFFFFKANGGEDLGWEGRFGLGGKIWVE